MRPAWQVLLDRVDGLGPLLAREAVCRAGAGRDAPLREVDLARLAAAARDLAAAEDWAPRLLYDADGRLKEFHVLPLRHWPGRAETGFGSVSACIDAYFGQRAEEERFRSLRGSLARLVRDEIARVRRKLRAQEESLARAESAETYRLQGELITANLWQFAKGMTEVRVVNYYDPQGARWSSPSTLPSPPPKTPRSTTAATSGPAAAWRPYRSSSPGAGPSWPTWSRWRWRWSRPSRCPTWRRSAGSWRPRATCGRAGPGGRVTRAGAERPGTEEQPSALRPITLRSSDGLEIWIGRNNRQNDYLTLKLAGPQDLWFHTKEIPGSHVILRAPPGKEVPERSIQEAAALAAYHSKARQSSGVPVDYTARKHVRKPNGARPGMVIYDNHKTLWVTPDPELFPILKRGWSDGAEGAGQDDPDSGRGDRHRGGHPEGAPGAP